MSINLKELATQKFKNIGVISTFVIGGVFAGAANAEKIPSNYVFKDDVQTVTTAKEALSISENYSKGSTGPAFYVALSPKDTKEQDITPENMRIGLADMLVEHGLDDLNIVVTPTNGQTIVSSFVNGHIVPVDIEGRGTVSRVTFAGLEDAVAQVAALQIAYNTKRGLNADNTNNDNNKNQNLLAGTSPPLPH